MMTLKIAMRSVQRNRRRSLITGLTIAVGAVALLMIGALMTYIILDFQTATVRRAGHLTVFREGFFDYGAGNPSAYAISDYKVLIAKIQQDPDLADKLTVITPYQAVFGLAGNYEASASKAFFGQGVVPAERRRLRTWNDYHIDHYQGAGWPLPDNPEAGLVGEGLAKILGLCRPLEMEDCPPAAPRLDSVASGPSEDFSHLAEPSAKPAGAAFDKTAAVNPMPRIDLLAATSDGAPNVVSMFVHHAEFQGLKDLDDNFIVMNLALAQKLTYGAAPPKVTGIIIQLKHTKDMAAVKAHLRDILADRPEKLEIRDFTELTPLYSQAVGFFRFLFFFFLLVIGLTVLFTVTNTVGMSVMERTNEIGAMRALGVQRRAIRAQFMIEGAFLGVTAASVGVVAAAVIATVLNHSGIEWTPPTAAGTEPLRLLLFDNLSLIGWTWISLVALSAMAALWPAHRAAGLRVIEALRHV